MKQYFPFCYRYGFHRDHCALKLKEFSGDVGQALEHLLLECYAKKDTSSRHSDNQEPSPNQSVDMETVLEQRTDEALALSSIYEEDFEEKIPNKVWTLQLDLEHLQELLQKELEEKVEKAEKKKKPVDPKDICQFYLRGNCRYGRRCYSLHVKPDSKKDGPMPEMLDEKNYELEIRFPEGNRYPYEAPLVVFIARTSQFPVSKSLNVCRHLHQECKELAEDGEPAIYSLISILEDPSQMSEILKEKPVQLSLPKILQSAEKQFVGTINRKRDNATKKNAPQRTSEGVLKKQDDDGEVSSSSSSDEEVPVTPEKPGKKFVFPRRNPRDVERDDRALRDQFRRKQASITSHVCIVIQCLDKNTTHC